MSTSRPSILSASPAAPGPPSQTAQVLFLIDELTDMGGAERALVNLVRLLPSHGFRCTVATFRLESGSVLPGQIVCPIHVFPLQKTYSPSAIRQAWRLARLIRSENAQIVHTFFETSDLWGGFVARLNGCPILISSRRDMGILRSRKHRLAYRMAGRFFDQVQTVSDRVRQYCIAADRLPEQKVVTIHNGVELYQVDAATPDVQLRESLGFDCGVPLIVSVANIRMVKGIDRFMRAAALVQREFPNAQFAVAGEVLEEIHYKDLRVLADSLELGGRFRFLGPRSDIFPILRMSSVFCLLSRSEGFSNSIVEAMASRLPCVVTDVGGNREAVTDGETGFVVSDENEAAERIMLLLRYPERARKMGELARRTVESRFTAEAMVHKIAGLYKELLRARSHGTKPNRK